MSDPKPPRTSLAYLEDALLDSIFELSDEELDAELKELGLDCANEEICARNAVARGIALGRKGILAAARADLSRLKSRQPADPQDVESGKALLERMKARDPELSKAMMMAARKGQLLSKSDEAGIAEDLADLERLSKDSD